MSTIEFQQLRIEALERELNSMIIKLEEAYKFMEKTAKEMEVEFEKL